MSRTASPATPQPASGAASGRAPESLAQARQAAADRLKAGGSSAKKSPKPDPSLANNPLVQLLKALNEPRPEAKPKSKKTSELMKLLSGLIESGAAQALAEGKPMAKDSHSALLEGLKGASSNQNLPANIQKLASSAHDFASKHTPGPNAAKSGSKTAGIMKDAAKIMCSENPTAAGMAAVMGKMKSMGTLGKIATGAGLVTGGITAAVLGPVAGAIVGGITAGITRGILGIGELIKAGADKLIGMAKGKSKESAKPEQPSSDLETDPTKITSASTDPNATPTPKPEPAAERKLDHEAQQSTRVDVTDPTSITSSSTAGQDQAPASPAPKSSSNARPKPPSRGEAADTSGIELSSPQSSSDRNPTDSQGADHDGPGIQMRDLAGARASSGGASPQADVSSLPSIGGN